MPDLFKRTMLKICEGFKKKVKKKNWKILGGGGVHHRPSGMEIPGAWGGGVKLNDHPWGGYEYFLESHISGLSAVQEDNVHICLPLKRTNT